MPDKSPETCEVRVLSFPVDAAAARRLRRVPTSALPNVDYRGLWHMESRRVDGYAVLAALDRRGRLLAEIPLRPGVSRDDAIVLLNMALDALAPEEAAPPLALVR
jgi:hypothetical protein